MLNSQGGIECDLTVARFAENEFYLVTGTGFRTHDSAWIRSRFELPVLGEVESVDDLEAAGQLLTIPLIAGAFLTDDERGNTLAAAWLPRFYAAMEDSDAPKQLADLLAEARM